MESNRLLSAVPQQIRYWGWLFGIATLEIASFFVVWHPAMNTVIAMVLTAIMAILAFRAPWIALGILATEYVVGSMGSLFYAFGTGENHNGISIRVLWFLSFSLGWFCWAWKRKTFYAWPSYLKGRRSYLMLVGLIIMAFAFGLARQQPFVFSDANAWFVLFLVLPVVDLARHEQENFVSWMRVALTAALIWLAGETIGLFYFFSHGFPETWTQGVYLWVRRTGTGEVTRVVGHTYRVFFQSHIYAVLGWIGIWIVGTEKTGRKKWIQGVGLASIVMISLSRSFFLGIVAMVLFTGLYILRRKGEIRKFLFFFIIQWILAFFFLTSLLWLPWPFRGGSVIDLVKKRADVSEEASISRWNLWPALWEGIKKHPIMGSGFGATITYQTKDPRAIQSGRGSYTTYAFEWGWLDFWYKFGVFGPGLMVILLAGLTCRLWRTLPQPLAFFCLVSMIGISVIHFFTPYLNHPLGFALLAGAEGLWEIFRKTKQPVYSS